MHRLLKQILQTEIDPAFRKRSQLILEAVEKLKPRVVLDAGCGRGFYLKTLTFFPFIKKIHGIDLNRDYLLRARKALKNTGVKITEGSLYKLPYSSNFFDLIICSEVLEHLNDDSKGLRELQRVLKPGGTLLITVPRTEFPFLWDPLNWILMRLFQTHIPKHIWWLAGIWADHDRLYSPKSVEQLVLNHGFKIKKKEFVVRACWPFSHFFLYAVGKNVVERLNINAFDRFSFKKKPASTFLANVMGFPSLRDNPNSLKKASVNIFIEAQK